MFDYHLLDMFELGIEKFLPMSYFKVNTHVTSHDLLFVKCHQMTEGSCDNHMTGFHVSCDNHMIGRMYLFHVLQSGKSMAGSKPCVVFNGPLFDTDSMYERLKNLLLGKVAHRHK